MTKKGLIIALIAALLLIGGYFVWQNGQKEKPSEKKDVKVGVIMPLTGPVAEFGIWSKNGIELYQSLNPNDKINYFFEDSKFDAKTGLNAYNKLVEVDKVDAIIVGMSKVAIPIIPLAERDSIPLLLQDVTYPNVTKNRNWTLRHFIQSSRESQALAQFAIEELGINTFGILVVQDEAGIAAGKAFEEFTLPSGTILEKRSFENTTTDFKSIVQPILNKKPDGIYLFGNGPSWAKALKTLNELGYKGSILTNTAMYIPPFRKIVGNAANGVYFTFPYIAETSESGNKFTSNYEIKFYEYPSIEAAYSYDLANIIESSYNRSNQANIDFKNAFLETKSIEGSFGKINIPPNRDIITPMAVGVIESDSIVIKKIISVK